MRKGFKKSSDSEELLENKEERRDSERAEGTRRGVWEREKKRV